MIEKVGISQIQEDNIVRRRSRKPHSISWFVVRRKPFLRRAGAVGQQRARRWQCLPREGVRQGLWLSRVPNPITARVTQVCTPISPFATIQDCQFFLPHPGPRVGLPMTECPVDELCASWGGPRIAKQT